MSPVQSVWPPGVFASIDAGLGVHLDVVAALGVPTIQLHAPHATGRTAAAAAGFLRRIRDLGIALTAVFGGFEGESYASIPVVEQTVGLVPVATRAGRFREMCEISDFARELECPVVALHLGFVPHDRSSHGYAGVIEVTQQLCDHVRNNGQALHLETGQESAAALIQFMDDTGRDNLFVNFDPANMILYGTGEPLEALRLLGNRVRSVHCKDARWSARPGIAWGEEVPFGEGQVDARAFLSTLWENGYRGPLTIEREIPREPDRQREEIGRALDLIRRLTTEIAGNAD